MRRNISAQRFLETGLRSITARAFLIQYTMITLRSSGQNGIDKFKEIYADDPFKARVFCFDRSPSISSLLYNNSAPGKFQVFSEVKTFGVTKTLKLFARKKMLYKIIVNTSTFYKHQGGLIIPVTMESIDSEIKPVFRDHFSWFKFLEEYDIRGISFNTIVRNKLYSATKALRYMWGCGISQAVDIQKHVAYRDWKKYRRSLINIENINTEILYNEGMFADTMILAYKLNETVNAAWSVRRFKEEHDKWSKRFTEIVTELSNRKLNIHPAFLSFNEFIGGGIILDTKGLAIEGSEKKHCVASYSNKIDYGMAAIFSIKNHTAEIINTGERLRVAQYRGFMNKDAPDVLRCELDELVENFNKAVDKRIFKIKQTIQQPQGDLIDLPF